MNHEHLAREAQRLFDDDVLRHALEDMRRDALEALAACDATSLSDVLRHQAEVTVITEFRDVLKRYIQRGRKPEEQASPYV